MAIRQADSASVGTDFGAEAIGRVMTEAEVRRAFASSLRSRQLMFFEGGSPGEGILIEPPEYVPDGGPFYPQILKPTSSLTPLSAVLLDDKIRVGKKALAVSASKGAGEFPGRSTTTPAVLALDGFMRFLDAHDDVALWKSSVVGDSLTEDKETRLLCLRAWLVPDATLTPPVNISYNYTFVTKDTLRTSLTSWCDGEGKQYFPIGWVTIVKRKLNVSGLARDHVFQVQTITWPCTSWMLLSNWMLPVEITSSFSTYCLGKLYARDLQTVIAQNQTIKFWPLPTGYNVPVGGKFLAQRMGSWYLAQSPILL